MVQFLRNNIAAPVSEILRDTLNGQAVGALGAYSLVALKVFSNLNPLAGAAANATRLAVYSTAWKVVRNLDKFLGNNIPLICYAVIPQTASVVAGLSAYVFLAALSTEKLIAINLAMLGVAIASKIIV